MLVHLYSTAYMSHDPYLTRFMSYLSLFTFCMLVLVTSDIFYNYLLDERVLVYVLIHQSIFDSREF
jgi:NADH:ubiquinone oxidoreductase subunit 5 (subunit L)/multisubunit Na+/H+ antiporter MnhA subunit